MSEVNTSKSEQLKSLVAHEGFRHVEKMIVDRIMDLQSILNLNLDSAKDVTEVLQEIKLRKLMIDEWKDFLAEVKGEANVAEFDAVVEDEEDLYTRE